MRSVEAWMRKARRDLRVAELALGEGLYDISIFHSQQAVEKALKAFLVYKGVVPPRTHNIRLLIDLCVEHDKGFSVLLDWEVDLLYPSGIEFRYPGVYEPDEDEAVEALEKARKTVDFVEARLNP